MKEEILFSVVMPIYAVEKYLVASIESVLNQTYRNFEIILVDDCSPDSCPTICDDFSNRFDNISVIHHKVNKGLSGARNSGLEIAKGDYIFFMDSDDVIENNLFALIAESLITNRADVVLFGLVEDYYDVNDKLGKSFKVSFGETLYLDNEKDIHREAINLESKTLYGYAWNKFYNLSYLKSVGVVFETITLIEDITFNVTVFNNLSSLNILDITPYHYMKRIDGSLTNKFIKDYYSLQRQRIEIIYNQYKNWNCLDEYVKNILSGIFVRYIFSAIQRNCDKRSNMNIIKRYLWLNDLFKDNLFVELISFAKCDSLTMKIMAFLLKYHCKISCLLLGRFIFLVKNYMPIIFSKVKQKR